MKKFIGQTFKALKREYNYSTSNKYHILFDHLPKCGGTTINDNLAMNFPKRYTYQMKGSNPEKSVQNFNRLPKNIRWNYKLIFGHLANEIREQAHPETLCTTIFREPIDRIISHYYFVKENTAHYLHEKVLNENIQLQDYCKFNLSDELSNYYVAHFSQLNNSEIEKNPKEALTKALNTILEKYHLIGFQSDIPAFLDTLEQHGNFVFKSKKRIKNKTRNRVKTKEISTEAKETIAQYNQLDLMLYAELINRKNSGVIRRF